MTGGNARKARSIFDGSQVLTYDGQNSATIDDSTKSTIQYLFDPRTLGLTSFLQPGKDVADCLRWRNAQSVSLLQRELVGGRETWHVRVVDSFLHELNFWIDERDYRVYKHEFRLGDVRKTVISSYERKDDVASPLPTRVYVAETSRGELLGERWLAVSKLETDVKINPKSWTLAGLDLPRGVPVSDLRVHERLGYWDGRGLSEDPVSP